MAYLDHQHTHKRIAGATGVALVHLALAAGLVTGLAVEGFVVPQENDVVAFDTRPETPPPDPAPTPEAQPTESRYTQPTVPLPPIDITRAGPVETTFDIPHEREVELVVRNDLPVGPSRPPEPPVPLFTPRPPVPANGPAGWVTNDDYPRTAIVREQEGSVGYTLGVNADGRVDECRITASSGFEALDRATCRLIERRARFRAGTDNSGAAVAGTWRGTVSWTIPED